MPNWWARVHRADIQLKKLEDWVIKQGFQVVKGRHLLDLVDSEKKIVFLCTKSKPIYQIYSLAHECGHLMTRRKLDKFNKDFNILATLEESESVRKPLRFYVEEIEEEILAWRNGYRLALQLKIPIDSDRYYKYASKYVMSYMTIAVAQTRRK